MSAHMPWLFNNSKSDGYRNIKDSIGHTIMCDEAYYPYIRLSFEEWKLVAAAPEMFELLKDIGVGELTPSIMNRIENLIQKIEGESPHDPERTRDKNE